MDAATIEQMNKVRATMGLAPLPVPGKASGPQFKDKDSDSDSDASEEASTLETRAAAAGGNWQKLEAERKDKLERQKRKDAAKKARDAHARFAKLEGKGLGDADEGEADTRTWLLQQKKRQKKIEKARRMEEELAAREREAQVEYSSKDLAGVKVGHEVDEFDDVTGEQILTLKDAAIGDESEDDELENQELRAKEQLDKRLQAKKKRPDYDPTEQGEKQGLLSKYDGEDEGKKAKRFTLDGQGTSAETQRRQLGGEGEVKSKGVKINLDLFQDDTPANDYLEAKDVRVKKPKKSKKEKKTRQKAADEDEIFPVTEPLRAHSPQNDAMEVDIAQADGVNGSAGPSKKRAFDLEDDDDLQANLAQQRRQALKKRKKMDATELARQMREEMPVDDEQPEDGGITIDETTEFVANLKKPEAPEEPQQRTSRTPQPASAASPEDEDKDVDGDTPMAGQSYAGIKDEEDLKRRLKRPTSTPPTEHEASKTGLEDEETMSGQGLGAALDLLRKRGLVENSASADLSAKDRQRAQFLADKQSLIDDFDAKARRQREAERESGRWGRMSNREKDTYARQQNEQREQYLSRLLAEEFNKSYRPDVKLQYHDEYGRSMNQKEAFKHLSHMFHGKGSGKQKTEKRLKRIEDEKRSLEKGVLSTSAGEGGFMGVQGREGKRTKQAGVRLQ